MSDIRTELQHWQHQYRVCESRFHNIVNNSVDGIIVVSPNGAILFSNPSAASLFGREPEDLCGMPFGFPIVGADRVELDIPLPAGDTIIVEMRIADTEWDGQLAFLTQLRDVTQRKQEEEHLRLAAKVFENSAEAIIILDMHMKLLSSNRAFTHMTGFLPTEVAAKEPAALWANELGPVTFQRLFREALHQRGRWQGEVQCYHKQGRHFPGWLSAVVVRDGAGALTHYVVIFSDISERKANENALRLAAVVFEQSAEAVFVLDKSERFVSVNRSFTEVTGYSEAEVLGKTPRLLRSGRQDKVFYRVMWRQIKENGHWQGEVWSRRKSGENYPEWVSVSVVRNAHGAVVNYIGIFSDITERKMQQDRMAELAFFDPLTKLPNRILLLERFKLAQAHAERVRKGIGLIFIDLDRFKQINDTHGHDVGDDVLIECARRFVACLRKRESLARLGGDEFVAVIETGDHAVLAGVAARLQQALKAKPLAIKNHRISLGLSAGIAVYPDDGESYEDLLKCADTAMYRAKQQGGGYCFYQSELSQDLIERIRIADRLKQALANDRLQLYYQAQIKLTSGELVGAEALLRWHDDDLGWISPARFIPIAEERGLMPALGAWVFRSALAQLKQWQESGRLLPGRLAINVSAQEVISPCFGERLQQHAAAASLLELELTEYSLVNQLANKPELLQKIDHSRFSLTIDDFGAGYSSLCNLIRFPVQKLKIDVSIVAKLLTSEQDRSIAKTIIAMARSLGWQVIAVGIEDAGQARLLADMKCELGQGYFYASPEPAERFGLRLPHRH